MARTRYTAQLLQEIPYEDRVCRIEYYPGCLSPADAGGAPRATIQQAVDGIADAGAQVWSIATIRHRAGGGIGRSWPLWDSKLIPRRQEWAEDAERLKEFVEVAHKRGILMLSYYPFIFTTPIYEEHPEWGIQMLDDGGEDGWNEGWLCWNSPYRDWLPKYLNEMIAYFDLDGIYFDDMNWGSHSDGGQRQTGGCICRFCKEQYLAETGRELPTKVDMEDVDFKRYITWRWGYPFNRSYHMFSAWRILALASTTRARLASFKPGFEPMRTAWTTSNGCGGPTASSVRVAATKAVGAWAMAASCVRRVRHAVR